MALSLVHWHCLCSLPYHLNLPRVQHEHEHCCDLARIYSHVDASTSATAGSTCFSRSTPHSSSSTPTTNRSFSSYPDIRSIGTYVPHPHRVSFLRLSLPPLPHHHHHSTSSIHVQWHTDLVGLGFWSKSDALLRVRVLNHGLLMTKKWFCFLFLIFSRKYDLKKRKEGTMVFWRLRFCFSLQKIKIHHRTNCHAEN